ncbi:hypothetical protein RJ639_031754 [Escallonia herrerae]|uniref:EF-hand domain-containing protein n=1 Tax=Escallonia herrerae TaxID=1293975 RepID=A0AA89BH62_9ASTE|nr:hypothetical protein RJ639_031754 [Escallonia herrerae]
MPNSIVACLSSLPGCAREVLQDVSKRVKRRKRRKPGRLVSDLSWITSSFAAMEVSNQLKHVFKFFDANGDGKISPVELGEVLHSLGHEKSLAVKEAEGIVREMDCNGDGLIDLEEFMVVMDSENGAGGAGREEDLKEAFRIFDSDKNGLISAEELKRVLTSLGCYKCRLRDCRQMIRGVDRDGDGFVDFEEFKGMMNAGCVR